MDENRAVVQAIQKLIHHPTNPWKEQLETLLKRADAGEDISVDAIDLLSQHDNIRRWMGEQVISPNTRLAASDYESPAGSISHINASQQWVCPINGCTVSLPVIQEGEDAPTCYIHNVLMVRLHKKG